MSLQAGPSNGTTTGSSVEVVQPPQPDSAQLTLVGDAEVQSDVNDAQPRATVHWTDDTVDNENMNKKKTKICCIFHKTRAWDESSSDESDCSSSSDSEDDDRPPSPNAYERQPKYGGHKHKLHKH